MKRLLLIAGLIFWLIPVIPTNAHDSAEHDHDPSVWAGTDLYLRETLGMSHELEEGFVTEKRQAFDFATGETNITDPVGDALSRTGTTQTLRAGWGDIASVELKKDIEAEVWHVYIEPGDAIPEHPSRKTQYWILFDAMDSKNADQGIRIDMDTQFMLKYFPEDEQWYTDFRWYNEETDFWAVNKETTSGFDIQPNLIDYRIPFEELSPDLNPNWRVVAAIEHSGQTQVDVAPTVGFPPPKAEFAPEETPNTPADTPSAFDTFMKTLKNLETPHYLLIGSLIIAAAYLAWSLRK